MKLDDAPVRGPLVYATILLAELLFLGWRYAVDPPSPSHPFSVGLGWAAIASMVALLIYSLARRMAVFRKVLTLRWWLHFHIFLGIQGPLLAVFHSLPMFFRDHLPRLQNPAFLNLVSVLVVFFSGIYGRYLYAYLPRRINGERLTLVELQTALDDQPSQVHMNALSRRMILAERRLSWFERADKIFRRWIVVHRPLATIMYILTFVHILFSYMYVPSLTQ